MVTVTYGDRLTLCAGTIARAAQAGVGAIVVVTNGVTQAVLHDLKAIQAANLVPISLVSLEHNEGSAGGFAVGLAAALDLAPEFIWLLDDDNWPTDGALNILTAHLETLTDTAGPVAVGGVRPARPAHRRLLDGWTQRSVYPPPSSYMSFDLLHRFSRVKRNRRPEHLITDLVDVPYLPYGGLLIPSKSVRAIGLPNRQFVLYEDDTEYTHRVVRSGGRLMLALSAVIDDVDTSWSLKEQAGGLDGLLLSSAVSRLRYSARNRAFFDTQRYAASRTRLVLNRLAFKCLVRWRGCRLGRRDQARIMLSSLARGDRGELGMMEVIT